MYVCLVSFSESETCPFEEHSTSPNLHFRYTQVQNCIILCDKRMLSPYICISTFLDSLVSAMSIHSFQLKHSNLFSFVLQHLLHSPHYFWFFLLFQLYTTFFSPHGLTCGHTLPNRDRKVLKRRGGNVGWKKCEPIRMGSIEVWRKWSCGGMLIKEWGGLERDEAQEIIDKGNYQRLEC